MTEKEIIQAADKDFDIEAVDMRDDLDFYNVYRAGVIYGQNHPNILKKDEAPISVDELKRLKACEVTLYAHQRVVGLCPICGRARVLEGLSCPVCDYDNSSSVEEWKQMHEDKN